MKVFETNALIQLAIPLCVVWGRAVANHHKQQSRPCTHRLPVTLKIKYLGGMMHEEDG